MAERDQVAVVDPGACGERGFTDPARESLAGGLREEVDRWAGLLSRTGDPDRLPRRPARDVRSPLEHAGHVRRGRERFTVDGPGRFALHEVRRHRVAGGGA